LFYAGLLSNSVLLYLPLFCFSITANNFSIVHYRRMKKAMKSHIKDCSQWLYMYLLMVCTEFTYTDRTWQTLQNAWTPVWYNMLRIYIPHGGKANDKIHQCFRSLFQIRDRDNSQPKCFHTGHTTCHTNIAVKKFLQLILYIYIVYIYYICYVVMLFAFSLSPIRFERSPFVRDYIDTSLSIIRFRGSCMKNMQRNKIWKKIYITFVVVSLVHPCMHAHDALATR
jgi:hypothetical protein